MKRSTRRKFRHILNFPSHLRYWLTCNQHLNRFVKRLIYFAAPLSAALLVIWGCSLSSEQTMQLCNHSYALCTSALCVPHPGDSSKAICFCDVENGPSMSTVPCDRLTPSTDANGIKTIYSTFSHKQFSSGKKGMQCPSGTPWTWCLNKRCTVSPSNPEQAICICDVMRSGAWMTLGGDCDPATCETGYWSGAAIDDFNKGNVFLSRVLGLEESPVNWCESTAP